MSYFETGLLNFGLALCAQKFVGSLHHCPIFYTCLHELEGIESYFVVSLFFQWVCHIIRLVDYGIR